jgi:hypothetical protein
LSQGTEPQLQGRKNACTDRNRACGIKLCRGTGAPVPKVGQAELSKGLMVQKVLLDKKKKLKEVNLKSSGWKKSL